MALRVQVGDEPCHAQASTSTDQSKVKIGVFLFFFSFFFSLSLQQTVGSTTTALCGSLTQKSHPLSSCLKNAEAGRPVSGHSQWKVKWVCLFFILCAHGLPIWLASFPTPCPTNSN
ncbi:hypothetical protein BD289DRAFT_431357 [Coniella lustricola]|uniref:Uncharacterized protein n=1 Tax=Coniella lustricola TaxID=2025994 RepID=A0A2T3AB15_9PEZI|nr:hypothetical protein BD289DRAFT_431357 [Coniella lustricola]